MDFLRRLFFVACEAVFVGVAALWFLEGSKMLTLGNSEDQLYSPVKFGASIIFIACAFVMVYFSNVSSRTARFVYVISTIGVAASLVAYFYAYQAAAQPWDIVVEVFSIAVGTLISIVWLIGLFEVVANTGKN